MSKIILPNGTGIEIIFGDRIPTLMVAHIDKKQYILYYIYRCYYYRYYYFMFQDLCLPR